MTFHCRCVNLFVFPQAKFTIRYENFIVVPDSSGPNFQVHIARQHVSIFSHAIINFARCVTESVLVSFDIFPNAYSAIHDVLEII